MSQDQPTELARHLAYFGLPAPDEEPTEWSPRDHLDYLLPGHPTEEAVAAGVAAFKDREGEHPGDIVTGVYYAMINAQARRPLKGPE